MKGTEKAGFSHRKDKDTVVKVKNKNPICEFKQVACSFDDKKDAGYYVFHF